MGIAMPRGRPIDQASRAVIRHVATAKEECPASTLVLGVLASRLVHTISGRPFLAWTELEPERKECHFGQFREDRVKRHYRRELSRLTGSARMKIACRVLLLPWDHLLICLSE